MTLQSSEHLSTTAATASLQTSFGRQRMAADDLMGQCFSGCCCSPAPCPVLTSELFILPSPKGLLQPVITAIQRPLLLFACCPFSSPPLFAKIPRLHDLPSPSLATPIIGKLQLFTPGPLLFPPVHETASATEREDGF